MLPDGLAKDLTVNSTVPTSQVGRNVRSAEFMGTSCVYSRRNHRRRLNPDLALRSDPWSTGHGLVTAILRRWQHQRPVIEAAGVIQQALADRVGVLPLLVLLALGALVSGRRTVAKRQGRGSAR